MPTARSLVIACGALAREILAVRAQAGLTHLELQCLPADLHNRPKLIPGAVRAKIQEAKAAGYAQIVVAYADCGTGGRLDAVLDAEGVSRITGPHCYAFFAGQDVFARLAEPEPGTFYLTDFLVRQFDTLIVKGLGLDRHPELRDLYFGNYTRLVHLSQEHDAELQEKAQKAADRLGLVYAHVHTGMGELAGFLKSAAEGFADGAEDRGVLARHPRPGPDQGGAEDGAAPAARALRAGDRPSRHARQAHRDRRLSGRVAAI